MRNSEAARYARWSVGAAILLTTIVAGTYLYRSMQARQVRKHAPPPAPVAVQRQSSTFSISKVEGHQTVFTVTALRATEFKGSDRNILEDVLITILGRSGDRNDRIHTKSCEYRRDNEGIVCAGEVQMDLQSATEVRRQAQGARKPSDSVIHVATHNVKFNRGTGEATTDQDVIIEFPQGHGRGTGVSYYSTSGILHLDRNVEFTVTSLPSGGTGSKKSPAHDKTSSPLKVTGSKLEFTRQAGVARLWGPVRATQGARELTSAVLELEVDSALHARKLSALSGSAPQQRPLLVSRKQDAISPATQSLTADDLSVLLNPQGGIEKVKAHGTVHGQAKGAQGEQQLDAGRAELAMNRRTAKPALLEVNDKTFVESKVAGGGVKRLHTEAFAVHFAAAAKRNRMHVDSAETLAPGTLEWQGPMQGAGSKEESTRLSGNRILSKFDAYGQPRQLSAQDRAEVERHLPGRAVQTTNSDNLQVTFSPDGEWSQMDFSGNARLKEGERVAQADQARLTRSTQTAVLTKNAVVMDKTTRTTAQRISFVQTTGEFRGDGKVGSTDLAPGGMVNFSPVPANITAEHMSGNSAQGRSIYSGNARLWQGDSVMQADSIELQRDTKVLHATGNVIAEFPQAGAVQPSNSTPLATKSQKTRKTAAEAEKRWRVTAGILNYWGKEGRARLENNVHGKLQQQQILAPVVDLYFSPDAGGEVRQLSRAVGTGGVIVQEGERRGTAEQGEYIAAEEKFVLSGGNPTLTGALGDTTVGRKLTFFLADDTIVVDSENGTRTLTKHRVEK